MRQRFAARMLCHDEHDAAIAQGAVQVAVGRLRAGVKRQEPGGFAHVL